MMNDGKQQSTFLFHDYETFGTHPALDRPAQFEAIRTDDEFNVIGEPEVFYCKPADDYLPLPGHHCSHDQSITDRATTCNAGTEAHQYTT